MNHQTLRALLEEVEAGRVSAADAATHIADVELGHTRFDAHRAARSGFPEVIYGEGKTVTQVAEIFDAVAPRQNLLATRVDAAMAAEIRARHPDALHDALGRTVRLERHPQPQREGAVIVLTAGTSDLPVAHEAAQTCAALGMEAELISDVGVAGIHRLFGVLDRLRRARVLIVVAGMEGALASVVAGLVAQPVIAVPTSVGYGAAFGGVAALLGMLTSCASGVTVTNIDNGFGAACAAARVCPLEGD